MRGTNVFEVQQEEVGLAISKPTRLMPALREAATSKVCTKIQTTAALKLKLQSYIKYLLYFYTPEYNINATCLHHF